MTRSRFTAGCALLLSLFLGSAARGEGEVPDGAENAAGAGYAYRVRMPVGADANDATKRPAILFLHGVGGRELPLDQLYKENPILPYADLHREFPFIVITPQCPPGEWWLASKLDALYDEVMAKYPIDPDRFYLAGLSMGGFGCWMYSVKRPERFAAAVIVCGGGNPKGVERIRNLPVWNFHGAKDNVVPIQRSNAMVEALRAAGGRVRYTVYPQGGHVIYNNVFFLPEVYDWLLQQARGRPAQAPATERGCAPSEERAPRKR